MKSKKTHHLLYGTHAVDAALKNPKRQHKCLYISSPLAPKYKAHASIVKVTSPKEFQGLFPEHIVHQNIALETSPLPTTHLEDITSAKLVLALDQLTDPHNVGAILRSAACFNVDAILTMHHHAPSEIATVAKVACGALEHVPFVNVVNLTRSINQLKESGFWAVGLSEHGKTPLHGIESPEKTIVVIGAEGSGMRRLVSESCDFLVHLPTNPKFPTLNASNAAAVTLYELHQQQEKN